MRSGAWEVFLVGKDGPYLKFGPATCRSAAKGSQLPPFDLGARRAVVATLLGAASMVPGGLGTMEASLVFQLMAQGAKKADAVAIAIATRCVTLWCGVFIGLIAFTGVCMRTRPSKL